MTTAVNLEHEFCNFMTLLITFFSLGNTILALVKKNVPIC